MKKLLFVLVIGAAVIGGLYYRYGDAILPDALKMSINDRIDQALLSAPVDVKEFGGGTVTLAKGAATFSAGADSKNGFVKLGTPRAVVVKGNDADVLALVNVNGGGTGTFQYLVHFEFIGSEQKVHEVEKIKLGDRIIVDDIATEITSPKTYDVFVNIKNRKPNEPMSATPSVPEMLVFAHAVDSVLMQKAVIYRTADRTNFVLIASPLPNAGIPNSFIVEGGALGQMYFEGTFPVQLTKFDGTLLAQSPAQAKGDWMTADHLVPFTASLVAPSTYHGPAILILKNDNPSGDRARDTMVEIPVTVK